MYLYTYLDRNTFYVYMYTYTFNNGRNVYLHTCRNLQTASVETTDEVSTPTITTTACTGEGEINPLYSLRTERTPTAISLPKQDSPLSTQIDDRQEVGEDNSGCVSPIAICAEVYTPKEQTVR